ncbi:hypothetical protein Tco_0741781 [Tanacetum coccineum]
MDFVTRLPRTERGHDSIWVIVERLTKLAYILPVREDYKMEKYAQITSTKLWHDTGNLSRSSWIGGWEKRADNPNQGDLLRACMIDFGGSWDTHLPLILERVGPVAYQLELPQELSGVHDMFHISTLKKCLTDETLVIPLEEIQIMDKLQFVKEPLEIMDREVKRLKHSRIPSLKLDGIIDEDRSTRGNAKTRSSANTRTCS